MSYPAAAAAVKDELPENPCPVCHEPVKPDRNWKIRFHRDGVYRPCGASGLPYRTTVDEVTTRQRTTMKRKSCA